MSWYTDVWTWLNTQQSLDSMYLRNPPNVMDPFSLAAGGGGGAPNGNAQLEQNYVTIVFRLAILSQFSLLYFLL